MEIKDKTVLVIGASSGMGAAIAKETALAGAGELLLLARNENELKKVAAEIASLGGKARIYPVDLSNPEQVTAIARRIKRDPRVPAAGKVIIIEAATPTSLVYRVCAAGRSIYRCIAARLLAGDAVDKLSEGLFSSKLGGRRRAA